MGKGSGQSNRNSIQLAEASQAVPSWEKVLKTDRNQFDKKITSQNMLPVEGAKWCQLQDIESMRKILKNDNSATLIISDVHAQLDLLKHLFDQLDVLDSAGNRKKSWNIIQIGDLADGRDPQDLDTLMFCADKIDKLILGNHEAAILGATYFEGYLPRSEVTDYLRREYNSMYNPKLLPAMQIDGFLISHGGVNQGNYLGDTESVIEQIENDWFDWCAHSQAHDRLFAVDQLRGGTQPGGLVWTDWRRLVSQQNQFIQITGHSPRWAPEFSVQNKHVCIDTAGDALGIAIISKSKLHLSAFDPQMFA